ncbi:MAG: hypothetical protein ABIR50_10985 [Ginsengibacter sp.]
MKKLITFPIAALLILSSFQGCKKKSDPPQTDIEKILGKWLLVSDIQNHHRSGQDNITTITGTPGDIVDFRTDFNVYSDIGGNKDTSTYVLVASTMFLNSKPFDMVTLTANSFVFHHIETNGSDFDEVTISLKK